MGRRGSPKYEAEGTLKSQPTKFILSLAVYTDLLSCSSVSVSLCGRTVAVLVGERKDQSSIPGTLTYTQRI